MKIISVLFLLIVFSGCTTRDISLVEPTVSPTSMMEFFEVAESKDYHKIAEMGKEVFKQGLCIPDHAKLFNELSSSKINEGHIRYILYSFQGEASGGEVYLIY